MISPRFNNAWLMEIHLKKKSFKLLTISQKEILPPSCPESKLLEKSSNSFHKIFLNAKICKEISTELKNGHQYLKIQLNSLKLWQLTFSWTSPKLLKTFQVKLMISILKTITKLDLILQTFWFSLLVLSQQMNKEFYKSHNNQKILYFSHGESLSNLYFNLKFI